jgi:hypothetical protein
LVMPAAAATKREVIVLECILIYVSCWTVVSKRWKGQNKELTVELFVVRAVVRNEGTYYPFYIH